MKELTRLEIFQFEIDNIIYKWRKGEIVDLMVNIDPKEFHNIIIVDIIDIGKPTKFIPIINQTSEIFMVRYKGYKKDMEKPLLQGWNVNDIRSVAHFSIKDMPAKIRESKINKIIGN